MTSIGRLRYLIIEETLDDLCGLDVIMLRDIMSWAVTQEDGEASVTERGIKPPTSQGCLLCILVIKLLVDYFAPV